MLQKGFDTTAIENVTPAKVTIGTITPDSGPGKYDPAQLTSNIWTDFIATSRYENDMHRYMMGMASPGGFQGKSVAFVQLSAPTLLWIFDWTCARWGIEPTKPDPASKNPDWVLLDKVYEPAMVTVGPDGITPLYRLSGTFVYGHRNPTEEVLDKLAYALPPWLQNTFERRVQGANQADDIQWGNIISQDSVGQ